MPKYTQEQMQKYLYKQLFSDDYSVSNTQEIIKKICGYFDTKKCQDIFIMLVINIFYNYINLSIVKKKIEDMPISEKQKVDSLIKKIKELTNNVKFNIKLNINTTKDIPLLLHFFQDLQDYTYGNNNVKNFAHISYLIHNIITITSE